MKNNQGWNLQHSYTDLPDIFYEQVTPNPVRQPKLVIYNDELGASLGLNNEEMKGAETVEMFAGNRVPTNSVPIAQSYAGHQFGHFTMLGDGRAMLIGEQITPENKRFDIQLKGAGKTPYSRGGDGRAALGPMLREYIISEAMHGLNIPTTRSLAVVTTGEMIQREIELEGAILTRVASSHIRVGTFQFAAKYGEIEELVKLADYTIERHDPDVTESPNPYLAFLQEVIRRQAQLVAKWQLVGFIHGVMNTDNMTISGETIDYGPCAFIDHYDPKTVFSSIDYNGRYAYQNQPGIASWNLARFAESLLPLLGRGKEEAVNNAQGAISEFSKLYRHHYYAGMRAKLGIMDEEAEDEKLIQELLSMMQHYQVDYTNTFLALSYEDESNFPMGAMEDFKKWKIRWQERLSRQKQSKEVIHELMRKSNPALIPRNRWVEEAIAAVVQHDDKTVMENLLAMLKNPYAHSTEQKEFAQRKYEIDEYQTFCGT